MRTWRAWFAGLFAVSLVLVSWRYAPPAAVPASASETEFSAHRAVQSLRRILSPQVRHPTGTEENRIVRDRVVAELARLGLEPSIQREYVCAGRAFCTYVENIVARIGEPGPARSALLLTAHYDSVPAGPGASDDGAGVATVIEVARALLAQDAPLEHAVIILVTDGEELGLMGAKVFDRHPLWREVGVVLNAEARGTDGPSFLFETGDANAWIIDHYKSAAPRPSLHPHFHVIVPDGVFSPGADAGARWVPLDVPSGNDIEHLATRVAIRLRRYSSKSATWATAPNRCGRHRHWRGNRATGVAGRLGVAAIGSA